MPVCLKPSCLLADKINMKHFRSLFSIVILMGVLSLQASPVSAQYYFGKNKVQYTDFNWQVMTTEHFYIYFYSDESELAEIAARCAEESYRQLASKFNHEIYAQIPLIIYSNANHFVQTNVTWTMLPENVGGFTEFLKGRVVVPFNGSYSDFDRVIRHELVHVFMISKINRVGSEYSGPPPAFPPLWFSEGLAEYWSRQWDSEADLIVRDMVINGTLPSIADLWMVEGTYYMYKAGQSLCKFINDYYGDDKLTRLFDNWKMGGSFESIVAYTLGDDIGTISEKWIYYLKKQYFPQLAQCGLPEREATPLTQKQFAVRPVPVSITNAEGKPEQWVIYKANRAGYSAIYMMPADGDTKRTVLLLKGELSSKYESLHLLTSGIDQYDDRFLVFSSKNKERDVLYVYDIKCKEIVHKYQFADLVAISSPRFSPEGTHIVFTGYNLSGYGDIYMLCTATGQITQLTSDIYDDLDPSFSSNGASVIFASDRGEDGYEGYLSLYRLHLEDQKLERLTFGRYHDRSPSESPDGARILFSSDRGEVSAFNIFSLDQSGHLAQLTHYITGAFDPRFGAKPSEIYFSAYDNRSFHILKSVVSDTVPAFTQSETDGLGRWQPRRIDAKARATAVKYRTRYSLDIAQSTVAYEGVYGTLGGIQMMVSDILGDNVFFMVLSNTAGDKDDFLSSFNVAVTYLRRTHRLNWGVGAFHFYDEFYNNHEGYYYERLAGGVLYGSYPISKFDRIESSLFLRYSDKDIRSVYNRRQAVLATPLLSYVSDNSLWDATGPLEGRRFNLTVGMTYDFKSECSFNRLISVDFRHYLRLRLLSCVASRFFAFSSAGIEPQRQYLGGSWSFRGFDRRHFYNRNILFNSEELRFPLIDNFLVAFPVGSFQLRGIRGALFHDMGSAWDDNWDKWQGAFGTSVRIALGYLAVLRLDISRTHDFERISKDTKVDFFFGWNF